MRAANFAFTGDGTSATLLELYTSEGCSSCPPAEAWLNSLKSSSRLWKDLFPVAFHVDYWDGLGWPDRFARPAYTKRQRAYAARLGQDSVYTPEFVAAGREWRGWFGGHELPSATTATSGKLELSGEDSGRNVSSRYFPAPAGRELNYTINVALLGVDIVTDVRRGENGGHTLQHDFVVLDFRSEAFLKSKSQDFRSAPFDLIARAGDPAGAMIAWVSTDDGSIAQIAGGWLKLSTPVAGN